MDILQEIFLFLNPRELRLVSREYNQIIINSREFFFRDYGVRQSYQEWRFNKLALICRHHLVDYLLEHRNLTTGTFIMACHLGYDKMVRYLLDNRLVNADMFIHIVGVPGLEKISHVHGISLAIAAGHWTIAQRILQEPINYDIDRKDCDNLILGIERGYIEVMPFVLSLWPAEHRDQVIATAARSGKKAMMEQLMAHLDMSETQRFQYIEAALNAGHFSLAKEMLSRVHDRRWLNRIFVVAAKNGYLDIVKMLVDDLPHRIYDEALRVAVDANQLATVELLLAKEVNPANHKNQLLHLSASKGHLAVFKRLLIDPRVDAAYRSYNKILPTAAASGHLDIVKCLLRDPRVNPAKYDNCALRAAIHGHYTEIIETLCADPRMNLEGYGYIFLGTPPDSYIVNCEPH